jgi:hypothetical protein
MEESNASAQERTDRADASAVKYDSKNRISNRNQTSGTTAEVGEKNQNNGGIARRQFLGAVAVGVAASSENTESDESESLKDTVEWKASGVWEDHLIPARQALTTFEGVDIEEAKEELREELQKLEAIEVDNDH